jgi:hypothetical protein
VSEIERDEPGPHRETVDLAVDARWWIVRTRIATGTHEIVLEPRGGVLAGLRDGEEIEVPWGREMHLDYLSPSFNAVTAQRLDGTTEIDVVYLEPVTLEATRMRQRYELLGRDDVETPVGTFASTRWRYTSLASGWTSELWVAGDVVVRYDRAFELTAYDPGSSGHNPILRATGGTSAIAAARHRLPGHEPFAGSVDDTNDP